MFYNEKYFNIFKLLFPKSRLWSFIETKNLTKFIKALTSLPDDIRKYIDKIYLDLFPSSTRSLELWEEQYGIIAPNKNESIRRNTIAMRWKDKGGQSAYYLQNILQGNGFNVHVYENIPITDPNLFMKDLSSTDWVLTNGCTPFQTDIPDIKVVAGGGWYAGQNKLVCGYFEKYKTLDTEAFIPTESKYFPFCFFIGGDVERDDKGRIINMQPVIIPADRLEYFKQLVLSIKPAHTWALIKSRS